MAQLGELDARGRANAKALARNITAGACVDTQRCLFEDEAACEPVPVQLGKVRLERSRAFGAVWLGWLLWRALKLDQLLGVLMPAGRESVAWAEVVAILAIGRLCEPSSELHVAERWVPDNGAGRCARDGLGVDLRRTTVSPSALIETDPCALINPDPASAQLFVTMNC